MERGRRIRIGCSGWSYGHWRGVLYPTSGSSERWLELYAAAFDTVEVNATFYRLPTRAAVARWAEATPPGFCFAVKASRYLTHVKRLRELEDGVRRLRERIEPLETSGKLGPVLWQLPERFHRDEGRLRAALRVLPPGRNAFEFRHESWFRPDIYELLAEHGVALVAADRAGSRLPSGPLDAAGWSYVRLHHGRGVRGRYTPSEIRSWADRLDGTHGDVYAYFNNDWEGYAVANARALADELALERVA
jgi:uncharacterized protein YecE (DUF72 family)